MSLSASRETEESSVITDAPVISALAVYLEPLATDARVLVVGDGSGELSARIEELGARSVHAYDPALGQSLDARDGAFDLAVVADLGALDDVAGTLARLRRVIDGRGALVGMGRARTETGPGPMDAFPELSPSSLGYAELYDVFALRFEHVAMTGVVPFRGIVFAELGREDGDVGVSVDTRLADSPAPDVFVVIASREPCPLEPYAIVQVESEEAPRRDLEAEAAFAAMHLKAELLAAQLDEQRARLAAAETRTSDAAPRLERIIAERDAAVTRAVELEALLLTMQHAMEALERKVISAEQGMLERDDRIAQLHVALETTRREAVPSVDPERVAQLVARAERAEAALALEVADLAQVAEAHAVETAALEQQLRERARIIGALEKEIVRREQLVRELVMSLEEAGDASPAAAAPPVAEASDAADAAVEARRANEENARLRKKLDELALDVARREGELRAQAWRITELENAGASQDGGRVAELDRELAKAREELDALRQALRQEHALVEQLRGGRGKDNGTELGRDG